MLLKNKWMSKWMNDERSNPTFLTILKWLSQVNPGLPGFLSFWVSPGLCAGPSSLHLIYCWHSHSLFKIFTTDHLFADDVQAYVHGPPSSQLLLDSKIELLSIDLNSWMSSNIDSLWTPLKPSSSGSAHLSNSYTLDHALFSDRILHLTFQTTVHPPKIIRWYVHFFEKST